MRGISATTCSLLLTTFLACERPPPDESGAATGTRASSLSSDCTGLVPTAVPPGFSTTLQLSDVAGTTGATSDGLGNYAVGLLLSGSGVESWPLVDAQGGSRSNRMVFHTLEDNERQERHLFAQPDGGFLAFHSETDGNDISGSHRVVALRAYSGDGTQTGEHLFINLTGATTQPACRCSPAPPSRRTPAGRVPGAVAREAHVGSPGTTARKAALSVDSVPTEIRTLARDVRQSVDHATADAHRRRDRRRGAHRVGQRHGRPRGLDGLRRPLGERHVLAAVSRRREHLGLAASRRDHRVRPGRQLGRRDRARKPHCRRGAVVALDPPGIQALSRSRRPRTCSLHGSGPLLPGAPRPLRSGRKSVWRRRSPQRGRRRLRGHRRSRKRRNGHGPGADADEGWITPHA
jgi:hypothetical protein